VAYSGVWGGGFKTWLVSLPPAVGWVYAVPRSGSLGLVGGGQHLFMVRGGGYSMTSPILVRKFLGRLLPSRQGSFGFSVCPAKRGVDSVHTYVCFMGVLVDVDARRNLGSLHRVPSTYAHWTNRDRIEITEGPVRLKSPFPQGIRYLVPTIVFAVGMTVLGLVLAFILLDGGIQRPLSF
jgi:hypothetical protein